MDKKNIETIYPLALLQQAFLWHSLQTSTEDGLIHMRCTLKGDVDSALLQQAWQWVIKQHPVLRTSVHWEGVKQPLQVVAKQVTMPWTELDWRDQTDQQIALENFLAEDRAAGFELTQAPISRLALIQLDEHIYKLVWSCHHLMLDGWSGALVFHQVFDAYGALQQGQLPSSKAVPTYQNYVRWLKQQDEAAAAEFWRRELAGFLEATALPRLTDKDIFGKEATGHRGPLNPPILGDFEPAPPQNLENPSMPDGVDNNKASPIVVLSSETTAEMQTFLRSHRLTLNTLMQGIWALLLHRYSGKSDILFGATVSGRQGDLPGIESIVGLLINVLPVRVNVSREQPVLAWLQDLQTHQATASRYGYASPDQIQSWSEVSGQLFNSLLVIENYPIQTSVDHGFQVKDVQSGLVSTYGLTVVVKPGQELTILLQSEALSNAILSTLVSQFKAVLETILQSTEASVGELIPSPAVMTSATEENALDPSNLSRDRLEGRFFAPNNPLELKLTQIWEAVLGVAPLSVQDSFFDVGGNSLLAVQLFNEMQRQLDCSLPLATLFQAPNIRQFAALLSQEQPVSQWSSLVPIQTSGQRLPLFFHGGSADALTWARFSHLLGTERPFYALQRPDLDGSEVTYTTVEALATDCIREMRMVQPTGPYLVGGHCLGGAIAFEIAQQLQAEGEDVESVILIDSYRPGELPETPLTKLQSRLQLGVFWLRKNYYYHGRWENMTRLPGKILQKIRPARSSASSENLSSSSIGEDVAETSEPNVSYEYRYARAQKANEQAAASYVPRPYAGNVKLFRAKNQILDWYFGRELGWQIVAKDGVEIATVPGFFGNLFNQQSTPLLVDQLKTSLSKLP
ncbi:MAG: alpha/beta fold hydrolase [Cyanobacteria bacterium P01_D01_bin.156]